MTATTSPGQSKTADYKVRAQKLFDDLDNFFTELEKSGRKVMVVVVPEHGGALKGDKMQVSGLRDIPSPSITNVPTAVKFFGMKAPHEGAPIIIDQPSSYLAVSGWWCAPSTANVQRGQRQLAAVCRQPAAERGGVRERQRHRHPVSGQALCPAEWR